MFVSRKSAWKAILYCAIVTAAAGILTYLAITNPSSSLPTPSLKALAARHRIEVGNFAILTYQHDPAYHSILTSQFNLALVDNTPNWYFTDGGLRPSPDQYDFRGMDSVVGYAEANHMTIQSHHLVWGEEKWLPPWLKNGNYSPSQLKDLIHQHIETVASRYKGQIAEWTVVNEAMARGQHFNGLHDWWADHTGGTDYIDNAFRWARQADPNAALILNDFGNEHPGPIADATYDYIKAARARGVPIDGVGLQMHIDGSEPPSKSDVTATMRRFASLGVSVYVTEFDVNMANVHGSDADRDQKQAQIYYDMARACIESQVCKSFSILGVTDRENWYKYVMPATADPRPLPFDEDFQPKPAFFALRRAFAEP
jgi:endo-1,4-beta-xylanase